MHFDAFDRHDKQSFLHRLDPRVKATSPSFTLPPNALLPDGAWLALLARGYFCSQPVEADGLIIRVSKVPESLWAHFSLKKSKHATFLPWIEIKYLPLLKGFVRFQLADSSDVPGVFYILFFAPA